MDSLFPRIRNPQYLYLVRRHGVRVVKVRVADTGPRYVRVQHPGQLHARREAWKSLYHEYHEYYIQAKRHLEVDYEKKIAAAKSKLDNWERELRAINLTREEDL